MNKGMFLTALLSYFLLLIRSGSRSLSRFSLPAGKAVIAGKWLFGPFFFP
jgi:hypothetical protein